MASYGYVSARDRDVAEWRAEIEEIEAARAADAALARMTPDAVRALLLHHAAEEPCQRRAPDGWREWCAEFDRLALAFADAKRREAGGGMGAIVRLGAEIARRGERLQRPDLPLGRGVPGDAHYDWCVRLDGVLREMKQVPR